MVLTATYDTDIPFGMEVPQGHRNEFIQRDKSDHPSFQDGRQFTMLNVQTCLVWGPNKVEKHQRCPLLLYQGWPLICQYQISPQIQHGCHPSPHV